MYSHFDFAKDRKSRRQSLQNAANEATNAKDHLSGDGSPSSRVSLSPPPASLSSAYSYDLSRGRQRMSDIEQLQDETEVRGAMRLLVDQFQHRSAARATVLSLFTRIFPNLSPTALGPLLGVSSRHMRRLSHRHNDLITPQTHAYRFECQKSRQKKTSESWKIAEEFWMSSVRQTYQVDDEGDRLEKYYYDCSQDDIFESYWRTIGIDACRASADDKKNSTYIEDSVIEAYYIDECNAGRALKRTAFLSTKPDNCCYGKIREHKCATCRSGWENRAKLHSVHLECEEQHSLWNCPLLKCEEWKDCIHTDKEFEKHRQLDKSQRKLYKAIREDEEEAGRWRLKNGECLVCMDFSPYSGNYVRLRTMSEAMSSVQCLHLVAFKKSDGKITKQYFDYFGDESNDIYFVRHVLTDLVGKFNNENIVIRQIFSDGGPKHFRTRRSLGFVLVELALIANYSLPVTWHFFCANHGKSECDSRAAVVKTFLNRLAIRGYSSFGLDEVVDNVNNNYIQKLSDRNACIIDGIDRSEFTILRLFLMSGLIIAWNGLVMCWC